MSMALSATDPLESYRADLRRGDRTAFTPFDASWLAFGTFLVRAIALRPSKRSEYLRAGSRTLIAVGGISSDRRAIDAVAAIADGDDSGERIWAASSSLASDAEDAGAFGTARAILNACSALVGLANTRLQGRLLAQQARILRKAGDIDRALELYGEVAQLGETRGDPELCARAHLGMGVVARVRGNYPRAREEFLLTLAHAPEAEGDELRVHAHHGLLIAAAVAGDFETALRHGRFALEAAREAERVEVLTNLAGVCLDVGQNRAALNTYLRVLADEIPMRVRLTAFGGAALAAARLGDRGTVSTLTRAAQPIAVQSGFEYEIADLQRELAEAWLALGDEKTSRRHWDDALQRAKRGGYFEIVHRLEIAPPIVAALQSATIPLTAGALLIAQQLASGNSDELLLAAADPGRSSW